MSPVDVAVLLPVTIETRFYPSTDQRPSWELRVRVTPDDISVNRHRPLPTRLELRHIAELRAAHDLVPDLSLDAFLRENEHGRALWLKLCNALSPARASWLIATIGDQDLDTITTDDSHRPATVEGFPDQIEVWVVWQGVSDAERIAVGKPLQRDKLTLDLPSRDTSAWWNSWETAVDVGVGIVCQLPHEPSQIESLYVIGLSSDNPERLFADKVASGEFGAAEVGTPTNTVDGDPAADLAKDPQTWATLTSRRLTQAPSPTALGSALTGNADALGFYPDVPFDGETYGRIMVGSLYSALWGHPLKDLWGLGKDAYLLAGWMLGWLRPQGHLPPIRSGDLPYGLIPATSLARWRLHDSEVASSPNMPRIEEPLVRNARAVRQALADLAHARGTTVDADTEQLATLVGRTPSATGYSYRSLISANQIEQLLALVPGGGFDANTLAQFESEVQRRWEPGMSLRGSAPGRLHLILGDPVDIGMPLVLPRYFPGVSADEAERFGLVERFTHMIDILGLLQDLGAVDSAMDVLERFQGVLPDSLLFRLLLQSSIQARSDAARADPALAASLPQLPNLGDGPALEPVASMDRPETWQWAELLTLNDPDSVNLDTPAGSTYGIVRDSIEGLKQMMAGELQFAQDPQAHPDLDPEAYLARFLTRLESLLKQTIDSAATRIDPFITALAWRRFSTLGSIGERQHRLGIYGWVDAPFRGEPGPKPGGLLHAPSHEQVVTAIILRDRYLKEREWDGAEGSAWRMSITSDRIRMAEEMADEVRLGAHMREALGRRVEAIVQDPVHIRELRETIAPQRSASPDRFTVCNGEHVLALLAQGGLPAWMDDTMRAQLQRWSDAMDVYADLLIAQGVYQTVTRRHEAASATLNAAAGFSLPPDLEVVQTPRNGQNVQTTLLGLLPSFPLPAIPEGGANQARPTQLADPSVAAFIDDRFASNANWQWTFNISGLQPAAEPAAPPTPVDFSQSITLADLGLSPMDATLFPFEKLTLAALQRVLDNVANTQPELQSVRAPVVDPSPAPDWHRQAREIVAVLAGQPFAFADLHIPGNPDDPAAAASANLFAGRDQAIRDDLIARLDTLLGAGGALHEHLLAQPEEGLRFALRWGILPIDSAMSIVARAAEAAGSLNSRLQAAQAFRVALTNATEPANAEGKVPLITLAQIAEAIAALAAPEANLAILSNATVDHLANYMPEHALVPAPTLDEQWLTVLASVRPHLARLEALQLEPLRSPEFTPFTAYSTHPADPWQREAVIANRAARNDMQRVFQPSRMIAGYGPSSVLQSTTLAVGVIDAWGETVPEPRHTTQAAFHFNAPGARAPQAILLAVPPVVDEALDTATLVDIVRETRELAHGRMVTIEDLGELDTVLPLTLLSAPGVWGTTLLRDGATFSH